MRWFWVGVILLVGASVVLLARSPAATPAPTPTPEPESTPQPMPVPETSSAAPSEPTMTIPAVVTGSRVSMTSAQLVGITGADYSDRFSPLLVEEPQPAAEQLNDALTAALAEVGLEAELPAAIERRPSEPVAQAHTPHVHHTGPQPEAGPAPWKDPSPPTELAGEAVDDEGVILPISGSGTKDDPYIVPWKHLTKAARTYNPRQDKLDFPAEVTRLDGKWVELTGYVAFPVMAASNRELLVMLNQWDGCCIGIPPTPYDAVEVKLTKDADRKQKLLVWGTIRGKFAVDPYLVRNWLVALYVIKDAELIRDPLD